MEKISKIPGIGSPKMKKTVEKGKKITKRSWDLGMLFAHFTLHQWIFETAKIYDYMRDMDY